MRFLENFLCLRRKSMSDKMYARKKYWNVALLRKNGYFRWALVIIWKSWAIATSLSCLTSSYIFYCSSLISAQYKLITKVQCWQPTWLAREMSLSPIYCWKPQQKFGRGTPVHFASRDCAKNLKSHRKNTKMWNWCRILSKFVPKMERSPLHEFCGNFS